MTSICAARRAGCETSPQNATHITITKWNPLSPGYLGAAVLWVLTRPDVLWTQLLCVIIGFLAGLYIRAKVWYRFTDNNDN